jgi:hypothetical protein
VPDRRNRIDLGSVKFEPTPEEARNASLSVARGARDADDLAFLLDVLGLLPRNEDNPNDAKERRKLEKEELDRIRAEARQKQWNEQLGWLRRNDF